MRSAHHPRPSIPPRSAFAGFRFPPDVIVLAVRWYLRMSKATEVRSELPDWASLQGRIDGDVALPGSP